MSKNLKIALVSISGIVLLGLVAGAGYYLGQNKTKVQDNQTSNVTQSANQQTPSDANQPTQNPNSQTNPNTQIPVPKAMFSGKIQKITQDLGLFITENIDNNGNAVLDSKGKPTQKSYPATYYQAGKFLEGKYKDQTRVLGYREGEAGGYTAEYFFVTPDLKTYTLLKCTQYESKPDKSLDTIDKLKLGDILDKRW